LHTQNQAPRHIRAGGDGLRVSPHQHCGRFPDILVDASPGATLFDLTGLQVELEGLLGVKVDIRVPGELSRFFREAVLAEAAPI